MKQDLLRKGILNLYLLLSSQFFSRESMRYMRETKRFWFSTCSEECSYTLLIDAKKPREKKISKFEWIVFGKNKSGFEFEELTLVINEVKLEDLKEETIKLIDHLMRQALEYKNN